MNRDQLREMRKFHSDDWDKFQFFVDFSNDYKCDNCSTLDQCEDCEREMGWELDCIELGCNDKKEE